MADIKIECDINNFGPHTNLHFKDQIRSIKMGIFANNGTGKTFISRAFRLASPLDETKSSNNILTTDESKGKFLFKIINQNDSIKKSRILEATLTKDSEPTIKNDTGYLFHVFNSDYVSENLESYDYNPNGDISGYIMGKVNIDVSKEKFELNKLNENHQKIVNTVKDAVDDALNDLDILKIRKTIKEYKSITYENLIEGIDVKENESFESLKNEYEILKSMPDGMDDVSPIDYTMDISILYDVENLLSTAYDKSNLHQSFVEKIKTNRKFIEKGTELHKFNKNSCPFCKQSLNDEALKIIDLYNQYINDSEAKTIKKIENTVDNLNNLKLNIQDYFNKFQLINNEYNNIKIYLPSFKKRYLKPIIDNESAIDSIDYLIIMLEYKKNDVTSTNFDFKEFIKDITNFSNQLKIDIKHIDTEINELNKTKNYTNDEKLKLRKRLCNARYLELIKKQKNNINEIYLLNSKISTLEKDIEEKEDKSRINKKRKVIESLKYFLKIFFNDKYSFDKEEFCIKFKDKNLADNATHVLSDGEKGIVAFCYYLATVHTILKKEDDYKRLFFVIDDPISSMDYDFVYKVVQCIKELNMHFVKGSFDRFIILTHNLEFMNLLMGNKVIKSKYILEENSIIKWRKQLMLPYENHLRDILRISNGIESCSHTTSNSIRHVLETICKFEHRDKSIGEFVYENQSLKEDSYINLLIQDLSHGRPRTEIPPESDIVGACKVVINYISEEYPGQIKGLE